jgi:hypothetical protein
MIRQFNYTKRRRIPPSSVRIDVRKQGFDAPVFDANINLDGLKLPDAANVFVEAYYKASYQRFDFGTVGKLSPPEKRVLDEVERGSAIFFRVKVVDQTEVEGKLLAELDDIAGAEGGDESTSRYCILPVNFKDLGEQVWRLDFSGNRPVLEVANFVGAEGFVRNDPLFFSLVYPEAVRQVLRHYLLDQEAEFEPTHETPEGMWALFVLSFFPDTPPTAAEDETGEGREEWIESVVEAFCNKLQVKTKLLLARAQEGQR